MTASPDIIIVFGQTLQTHLKKTGRLDGDEFLKLFSRSGISENGQCKTKICGSPVYGGKIGMQQRVSTGKRDLSLYMLCVAETVQIIENLL